MTLKRRIERLEARALPAGEGWIVDVAGLTAAEAESRIVEAEKRLGPNGGVLIIDNGTDPGPFRPKGTGT